MEFLRFRRGSGTTPSTVDQCPLCGVYARGATHVEGESRRDDRIEENVLVWTFRRAACTSMFVMKEKKGSDSHERRKRDGMRNYSNIKITQGMDVSNTQPSIQRMKKGKSGLGEVWSWMGRLEAKIIDGNEGRIHDVEFTCLGRPLKSGEIISFGTRELDDNSSIQHNTCQALIQ